MEISKKDWKLFQEKLPIWQDAFMGKLNQEYIAILNKDGNPSDLFWELEKRIKQDKRRPGVSMEMQKQYLLYNLSSLIVDGAITLDDIDGFSEELKDGVRYLVER